jgi:hypothetical protein
VATPIIFFSIRETPPNLPQGEEIFYTFGGLKAFKTPPNLPQGEEFFYSYRGAECLFNI